MKCVLLLLCVTMLGALGCQTLKSSRGDKLPPLRIGVATDYAPIIFRQNSRIAGVEADLAIHLCKALGRKPEFVEMDFDTQLRALNEGKIDIVMSGMTVTPARAARATFCDAYLKSGQVAVVPAGEAGKYTSAESVLQINGRVGVVEGTTGDAFVKRAFKSANVVLLNRLADAKVFFDGNRMDMMVYDLFGAGWLVATREADLEGIWIPLTQEELAWAVRRDDTQLLQDANRVLGQWRRDGTLAVILDRWVSVRKNVVWD
jgi:ABC-type amino acid transport substrate-binding protein